MDTQAYEEIKWRGEYSRGYTGDICVNECTYCGYRGEDFKIYDEITEMDGVKEFSECPQCRYGQLVV